MIPKLIIALALALAPQMATAFEPADAKLYIGFPELVVDYEPGSEAAVYAIIEGSTAHPQVIYTITYNHKGEIATLGSFRCDLEFEVLGTSHSGMYDIKCVREHITQGITETVLQKDDNGYTEVYSD